MFVFYQSGNVEFLRLAPSDINLHRYKSHMLCDATRQHHVPNSPLLTISALRASYDRLSLAPPPFDATHFYRRVLCTTKGRNSFLLKSQSVDEPPTTSDCPTDDRLGPIFLTSSLSNQIPRWKATISRDQTSVFFPLIFSHVSFSYTSRRTRHFVGK